MTAQKSPPAPTLIDERMTIFLTRQLRDTIDHFPTQQDVKFATRTQKALKKLKQHNFGSCEQCGYPIDIGRILQDPTVEYCACCEHGIDCPVGHPYHL